MTMQELFQKADYYKNLIDTCGKPMKAYEADGNAQAYDYMFSLVGAEQLEITEEVIKRLHYLLCEKTNPEEAGQYRKTQVYIPGTDYLPPKAEEVPHFMEHFMNQMQSSKRLMHPIEFAAICHKRLSDIHPFKEGNGRTARLLMNLILVNAGYGITSIPPALHNEYINALALSQGVYNPDIDGFIKFIAECVIETEKENCRFRI